jgi:hypothetical protein
VSDHLSSRAAKQRLSVIPRSASDEGFCPGISDRREDPGFEEKIPRSARMTPGTDPIDGRTDAIASRTDGLEGGTDLFEDATDEIEDATDGIDGRTGGIGGRTGGIDLRTVKLAITAGGIELDTRRSVAARKTVAAGTAGAGRVTRGPNGPTGDTWSPTGETWTTTDDA